MCKYLIIGLVVFPSLAFASFDADLYYGMKSEKVTELQEFLTEQGAYNGPITGNFFSLTQKAVKSFQTTYLISSTGYFGPITRAKANTLLSHVTDESGTPISPVITAPKTNDDVVTKLAEQIALLQAQLLKLQEQQTSLNQQNQTLTEQNQKLGAIEQKVTEQASTLTQIQTNTAPVPPIAPAPQPIATTTYSGPDLSEIVVVVTPYAIDPIHKAPHGAYHLKASIFTKDGSPAKNAFLRMDTPGQFFSYHASYFEKQLNAGDENSVTWVYVPTSAGLKTITFTSGNLTKSVTIDVQ